MNTKYYIGPMTKNVVDAIIDYSNTTGKSIGLIPSRRQVEWDGGYVNNWTTETFSEYVKLKGKNITLQRDHSGPGQGQFEDDGYKSLEEDCKYLDLIHIDPWKKYPKYEDGLQWTVSMIKFCDDINPNLKYEVGTEEAIRRFEVEDLRKLLEDLKSMLGEVLYNKISYLVIQSGTSLKATTQTGVYNNSRLKDMINLAKEYKLLSKEHNGDYIPVETVHEKLALGLDAINIAPEFGLIETETYLDFITDENFVEAFWKICYDSKKWVKWVDSSFDPLAQKLDLIKICGHYVLTSPEFVALGYRSSYLDNEIQQRVKAKLDELYK